VKAKESRARRSITGRSKICTSNMYIYDKQHPPYWCLALESFIRKRYFKIEKLFTNAKRDSRAGREQ